jgi:hypothetical protein
VLLEFDSPWNDICGFEYKLELHEALKGNISNMDIEKRGKLDMKASNKLTCLCLRIFLRMFAVCRHKRNFGRNLKGYMQMVSKIGC